MELKILKADITGLRVDAIVNPTDRYYSGGGGVDRRIHELCGEDLRGETEKLAKLYPGEAKATAAFGLPAKYILHTSSPTYTGTTKLEPINLGSCYRNCMELANSLGCRSIAFPLIGSSGKHFPKELAFTVAVDAILEMEKEYPNMEVFLAIYGKWTENLSLDVFETVSRTIAKDYVPKDIFEREWQADRFLKEGVGYARKHLRERRDYAGTFASGPEAAAPMAAMEDFAVESAAQPLEDMNALIEELLSHPTKKNLDRIPLDESFSGMLTRILQEKNIPHKDVQDALEMSGVGFWKLLTGRSNPSKMTVFGIAFAMRLSADETKDMLAKAGYAVNPSSLEDVVLMGLLNKPLYDRNVIDDLLYSLDLVPLPGAAMD